MTAWDVIMDPIMVAGGNWVWDVKGAYFGIPLQNYWGWWLTIFTTFALYLWLFGKGAKPSQAGFDRLALGSYLVTALGIVAAVAGQRGGWAGIDRILRHDAVGGGRLAEVIHKVIWAGFPYASV